MTGAGRYGPAEYEGGGCGSLLNERRFISAFHNESARVRYYMQKYSFTNIQKAEADDHLRNSSK